MIYLTFQDLLLELTAYIVSDVINQWVRSSLNPMITLKIIIFEVERKKNSEWYLIFITV
jgi:UDP-N-acetylglucosamine transferase subunit ALG13